MPCIIKSSTVKPLNNRQVGASTLLSAIWRCPLLGGLVKKSKCFFVELFFNSNYDQKKLH